jgi:hypothetical protein
MVSGSIAFGRRRFLYGGSAVTAAAASGFAFSHVFARKARAAGPYGALVPDPEGILDLPAGFTYRILERQNDPMDDGYRVPGRPDGMGAFPGPDGTVILLRNHELTRGDFANGPYNEGQPEAPESYSAEGVGGVTRLVVDGTTFERVSSNLVLVGTARNCAGGVSPWGWLTCEENTAVGHGYVFLCAADADRVQEPQRITGYGRCNHEAAVVDPETSIAYLTEDRGDSAIYRFVPDDPKTPFEGRLQAMRVVGEDGAVLSDVGTVGTRLEVDWVDIEDPDPTDDTLRSEAQSRGAALLSRGEGIFFADGDVHICSTDGGPASSGQIFRYRPSGPDGGELVLVGQSEDSDVLDKPDNIAMAPWGELFMCEDGSGDNYVRILTSDGEVCDFARNATGSGELAGACFSPDSNALFVNLQANGLTVVVTGPFPTAPMPPLDGGVIGGDDAGVPGADSGTMMPPPAMPTPGADDGCGCASSGTASLSTATVIAGAVATVAVRGRRAEEEAPE